MRCPECGSGTLKALSASVPFAVICDSPQCHSRFVVEGDGSLIGTSDLPDILAELKEEGASEFDLEAEIIQLPEWDGKAR